MPATQRSLPRIGAMMLRRDGSVGPGRYADEFRDAPFIAKPYREHQLLEYIRRVIPEAPQ